MNVFLQLIQIMCRMTTFNQTLFLTDFKEVLNLTVNSLVRLKLFYTMISYFFLFERLVTA